jgi:hypothetical protein
VLLAAGTLLAAALGAPAVASGQTDAVGELTQTLPKLTEQSAPDTGSQDPVGDLLNQVSEPVQQLLRSAPLPTGSDPPASGGGGSDSSPSGAVSPASSSGDDQSGSSPSAPDSAQRSTGTQTAPRSTGGGDGGDRSTRARSERSRDAARAGRARRDRAARRTLRRVADQGDRPSGITGAIREVVEVVPGPLKVLLGLLGALVLVLGGGYLIVTRRARRLARHRSELLEEVGLLQQALLPDVPGELGPAAISVAYRPADGPGAGGDFYDAFELTSGQVAIVVGDVSGHGRQALARTTLLRYTLRAYLDAGLEPRAALQVAGRTLDNDLQDEFATVVLAVYDGRSGVLTYASAGHPAPIVVGPGDHEPVTACSSPPIGVSSTTGMRQTRLPLPEGAVACFFTDGLVEARIEDQVLGRARLHGIVEGLGAEHGADTLLARVREAADRTTDDMAACLLRPTAAEALRDERVEELEVEPPDLPEAGREFLIACGVEGPAADDAVATARRTAASDGRALLRVTVAGEGAAVEVEPVSSETLEQVAVAPSALPSA